MLVSLNALEKVRILNGRFDDKVNGTLEDRFQCFLEVEVGIGVGAGRKRLEFDQKIQVAFCESKSSRNAEPKIARRATW